MVKREQAAADHKDVDYRALAEFRFELRRFQAFSEAAALQVGLTAQQHQALLAIMGFGSEAGLGVGVLAERLLVRHNSAAELVNRLETQGLVTREADATDARRALVRLSAAGKRKLLALSNSHLAELRAMGPALRDLLARVDAEAAEPGP